MKLTDKYLPEDMLRESWKVYDQCSEYLGTILDNKYPDTHILVYEHTRHTASEVFKHSVEFGDKTYQLINDGNGCNSIEEELDITKLYASKELHRRLNIIGDVGVGKTTFLLHLKDVHVGKSEKFGNGFAVYVDWADFTASSVDALTEIKKRFVIKVTAVLEKMIGIKGLAKLDNELFFVADIFSNDRLDAEQAITEEEKIRCINEALTYIRKNSSVELIFARLNHLCKVDRNAVLLIIDNIDHLPEHVLKELSSFLVEVQLNLVAMMLVGMRDHTYNRGFSLYREDKAVPSWHSRLKPPNIRFLLERRIQHFLPKNASTIQVGAGILNIDRDSAKICSTLLSSPLSDIETYNFICAYSNFSIRDLFISLQIIIGSPGYIGYDKEFFLFEKPKLHIGIDECLIALGLRDYHMFFPDKSPLFNPYSAGADEHPLDKIVAARILQLLDHRIIPIPFSDLVLRLAGWGYSKYAIDSQLRAMVDKDLIWTSAGAPNRLPDATNLRLSYRGHLYIKKILKRTVFNYMMSFNVEAPSDHQVLRHHKSEFMSELTAFGKFNAPFDSGAAAERILGLAEIIAESERHEVKQLLHKKNVDDFKSDVSPKSVSVGIIEGLEKFLLSTLDKNGNGSRFIAPSTDIMKRVGEAKAQYIKEFRKVFV